MKFVRAHEAVKEIQSGNRVFVQSAAMTPLELVDAMSLRYQELKNVEVIHIHTEGEAKYTQEPYNQSFHTNALFVGANTRKAVNSGAGSYTPMFLGDVHILFRRNILPIDVALIQVSPPDQHGFCSLGVSIDITLPAIETAKKIIAQVNPNVPRTHGDGIIHKSRIDAFVESNSPIYSIEPTEPNETDIKIGAHVAGLVEDGATLQMGIGAIPNVVLSNLGNHKNLGIHTEMFSDGVLPLYESGVITGKEKQIKTGKIVTCFAMGSQKLYDFVNENPVVHFKEAGYTNDTAIIRRNPKVTAINSAIEIDLTGQVCADTIGSYQFSGVGGQMDFIRGASLSEGGKPIFALASQTKKGVSKIVPQLKVGAGVTTTRAHVHYIATEFGVVNLFAKSLRERAKLLISIAHPDHQEELEKQARELNLV
ncbi:4-hydroxybutyrate CoA-transferase [Weeksellaceae bacterium KMM 9724]|uniref:acetyl-CoA hydrolase/transferase family protein n=1 Tax=Profundicola chukchiensis TaxID=2961959 RepID=UPI00243A0B43|nr:acetyl-CoA hydrolase/transferase C-terminal domain-containing protein [Profundicola chukchiensis]MDG4951128.1 4-hydroxybutyrate CoA-transferase [Profundicola chukchiensis]